MTDELLGSIQDKATTLCGIQREIAVTRRVAGSVKNTTELSFAADDRINVYLDSAELEESRGLVLAVLARRLARLEAEFEAATLP